MLIPEDEKNLHTWYTVMHCFLSVLLFLQQNYISGLVSAYVWFKCRAGIVPFGSSKTEFENSIKDWVSRAAQQL